VAFSPDGQFIASASNDNTARIWDLQGNPQQVLQGHANSVNTVSFSPNGETLGTTSRDGTARLWNLAALNRQGVVLLDTEGQLAPGPLLRDPEGTTSPWSRDTYVQEHSFFLKAGEKLLIRLDSQDFDPFLRLLDPEGQPIAVNDNRFGQNSGIGRTLYQPGTYRIQVTSAPEKATGSYRLSVTTAEPEIVLRGHRRDVRSLDFSPGGDQVVTASEDATLKLWSIQGRLLQTLAGHAGMVNVVSFTPDGAIVSASGDRTIKIWQPSGEDLSRLKVHASQVSEITYTPDGQTLATAGSDGTIKLWNARTSKELQSLRGHSGPVWDVSVSPNGQTLASAGSDDTIKLWDVKTGKALKTLEGHQADVNSVRFAPDGQALASASKDGTVKLWNPRTGQLLLTLLGHQGPVLQVTFSPDGQTLASAGEDRRVKLWNVITGEAVETLEGHLSQVSDGVFSPDGGTLATGGLNDGVVKLWNVTTGKELETLAGHTDGILALSFSPDGQTLASASIDRTVKLWNVTTGKELQTLEGHRGPVQSVTFAPDGQTLASGDREDGTRIFWNLNLEDLMGRSCGWLADYMANPATPLEEKVLCKGYLPASRPLSFWAPWHWLGQVRGFWQGLGMPPGSNLSPVGEPRFSRADAEQGPPEEKLVEGVATRP
jgi:WD40 repeat protein